MHFTSPESLTENVSAKHRLFCPFPFLCRCFSDYIGCCETLYVIGKLTWNKNKWKKKKKDQQANTIEKIRLIVF